MDRKGNWCRGHHAMLLVARVLDKVGPSGKQRFDGDQDSGPRLYRYHRDRRRRGRRTARAQYAQL